MKTLAIIGFVFIWVLLLVGVVWAEVIHPESTFMLAASWGYFLAIFIDIFKQSLKKYDQQNKSNS